MKATVIALALIVGCSSAQAADGCRTFKHKVEKKQNQLEKL